MVFSTFKRSVSAVRYRLDLVRGRAAGEYAFVQGRSRRAGAPLVDVFVPAGSTDADQAAGWTRRLGIDDVARVCGFTDDGLAWSTDPTRSSPWFTIRPELDSEAALSLESMVLAAWSESLDAVVTHRSDRRPTVDLHCDSGSVFRSDRFEIDWPSRTPVRNGPILVKWIGPDAIYTEPRRPERFDRTRRGPYESTRELPATLEIAIDDLDGLTWPTRPTTVPTILVTTPFLATGGAEHTLIETMRVLADRWRFVVVTLAPHRSELGDRRRDVLEITPHLYCLGDVTHPAAMPGVLRALMRRFEPSLLYNANGTTLFYELAPELAESRPGLRIVDHLYDHGVGYIDEYRKPRTAAFVDVCVAENHPVSETLRERHGWPADRVPVVWPCGRPGRLDPTDATAIRARIRDELGIGIDDLLVLTAARAHEQKRPLDLVALAHRCRELPVRFLWVGGGPLEQELDRAIRDLDSGSIVRHAFRSDVPELIEAADVGCLVSEFEGLPVFMIECLQAGRPFLGPDVGDLGRVLSETGAGFVVARPGDLDAFEAAIRRLLDPALRGRLAEAARNAAEAFTVSSCAQRYHDVFESVLRRGSS